ncbi:MAG: DUF6266 family protein [Flavobacteriales bacterium]
MGKISQGVLGGFSGKVGNVVGGTWKGIDYMRIKPANVSNPRTAGQVDQRSKFSTTLKFLQSMTDFLRVGFKLYANKMTQFNAAMSYNLNNAITGTYPNFMIDYASALVSRGGLTGAANGAVSSSGGLVEFTWTDNTGLLLQLDGSLVKSPENGDEMVLWGEGLDQSGRHIQHRIIWRQLNKDSVQQRWQVSHDQGLNWQMLFDGTYYRQPSTQTN